MAAKAKTHSSETEGPPPEWSRDYIGIALEYARVAVADKKGKSHCKWVRLAAKRQLNDLKRWNGKAKAPYYFDEWEACNVCDFIEKLPHVEGNWETPTLTLEPCQIFSLTTIFGWRRRDGTRRFTYVYEEMARKAAKSTKMAGVSLYCLTCDNEPGPQIIIGATTGEQAGKVYDPAKTMVDRTPDLREAYNLQAFAKAISCFDNGGYIKTINAKGKTQDGWNPHLAILDELHAHPNRALFDVIRNSMGARRNQLMWVITTAGFNLNGICYEQRSIVTKVLQGALEMEHLFGIIYTLDEDDDPFEESNWVKANPMIGVTPSWDKMRELALEAQAGSDGDFKTKRLNLWLNSASSWLNIESWKKAADESLSWDDFRGLDCYIGADLADKDDITAVVLAAIDGEDRLIFKPMFWLPEAVLKNATHGEGKAEVPYRRWVDEGRLHLTPGDWVDHTIIESQVREWIEHYGVRMCTFDQFAAAQGMASKLNEDLATPDRPIAQILHKKASAVTDPAKELEARVKSGIKRLRHDGNPVMTWMASNAVIVKRRDNTILPIKETQDSPNKIDGIDALINAIAPLVVVKQEAPFVYEQRGLRTL
jgi:phage terminase large subunit-like protein